MFCTNCGSQLPDGAKFCTECGSVVETASMPEQPTNEPQAVPTADQTQTIPAAQQTRAMPVAQQTQAMPAGNQVFEQGAYVAPAPKPKTNKALYAAIAAILVIGAGAGVAFAVIHSNTANNSANVNVATEQSASSEATTAQAAATSEAQTTDSSEAANTASTTNASSTSPTTTQSQELSYADTQRQTALNFAKCYWTNAYPAGANNESYVDNSTWTQDVLSYLAPNTNLYNEMVNGEGAGFLDAEDYCTNVEYVSTQQNDGSGCETVKVYVAGYRQNPVANWASTYTHTYTMQIYFNTSGQVTGFTSIYTDPSTGKTYTAEH